MFYYWWTPFQSIIGEDNDENAYKRTPTVTVRNANRHEHTPCFCLTWVSPP